MLVCVCVCVHFHLVDLYISFGLLLFFFIRNIRLLFKMISDHTFNRNQAVLLLLLFQPLERKKQKQKQKQPGEISFAGILIAVEAVSIDIISVMGKKVV